MLYYIVLTCLFVFLGVLINASYLLLIQSDGALPKKIFSSVDGRKKTTNNHLHHAGNLYKSGRFVEAAQILESINMISEASRLLEHSQQFNALGKLWMRKGNYKKAGKFFLKADSLNLAAECFSRAGLNKKSGDIFRKNGSFRLAIAEYQKANYLTGIAQVYSQQKEYRMAGRQYLDILASDLAMKEYKRCYMSAPENWLLTEFSPSELLAFSHWQKKDNQFAAWSLVLKQPRRLVQAVIKLMREGQSDQLVGTLFDSNDSEKNLELARLVLDEVDEVEPYAEELEAIFYKLNLPASRDRFREILAKRYGVESNLSNSPDTSKATLEKSTPISPDHSGQMVDFSDHSKSRLLKQPHFPASPKEPVDQAEKSSGADDAMSEKNSWAEFNDISQKESSIHPHLESNHDQQDVLNDEFDSAVDALFDEQNQDVARKKLADQSELQKDKMDLNDASFENRLWGNSHDSSDTSKNDWSSVQESDHVAKEAVSDSSQQSQDLENSNTSHEYFEVFGSSALLNGLTNAQKTIFWEIGSLERVDIEETFDLSESPDTRIILLLAGRLHFKYLLRREEQTLDPGSEIGAAEFFAGRPLPVVGKALLPSIAFIAQAGDTSEMVKEYPSIARHLYKNCIDGLLSQLDGIKKIEKS